MLALSFGLPNCLDYSLSPHHASTRGHVYSYRQILYAQDRTPCACADAHAYDRACGHAAGWHAHVTESSHVSNRNHIMYSAQRDTAWRYTLSYLCKAQLCERRCVQVLRRLGFEGTSVACSPNLELEPRGFFLRAEVRAGAAAPGLRGHRRGNVA